MGKCVLPFVNKLLFSLLFVLNIYSLSFAQEANISFEYITSKNGLSQNSVEAICQDKNGFLWFGTGEGLNRYDGFNLKIFKYNIHDSTSVSNNDIYAISEDSEGFLWIGTRNGLNRYDPKTETFTTFHKSDVPGSISGNNIQTIFIDKNDNLWIGTLKSGLNFYDKTKKQFKSYFKDESDINSISDNSIYSIYEDKQGILWFGTKFGGVNRLDPKTEKFQRYEHNPEAKHSISGGAVRFITQTNENNLLIGIDGGGLNIFDKATGQFSQYLMKAENELGKAPTRLRTYLMDMDGSLWIGTLGDGLIKLNINTHTFEHYQNNSNLQTSINSNTILSLFKDKTGTIWVGTDGGGINKLKQSYFFHYTNLKEDENSISSKLVWSFLEDENFVLIGTRKGVNILDKKTNKITKLFLDSDKTNKINNNSIWTIAKERKRNFYWLGTSNGLIMYDKKLNHITHYNHDHLNETSISSNRVSKIFIDSHDQIWIGTGNGLNIYKPTTNDFEQLFQKLTSSKAYSIVDIIEDQSGHIWISTRENGIYVFNQKTELIMTLSQNDGLSSNLVLGLLCDHKGYIWIGTTYGLDKYNTTTKKIEQYFIKDGLPNEHIYGILEDDQYNIWFSTNNGLSKFDPIAKTFRNFTINDGLQDNEFNVGAFLKLKNGTLLFGGINGFNMFNPEFIKENNSKAKVIITKLKIFNNPVKINEQINKKVILKESISYAHEVTLSYKEDFFSLEFAALHFTNPEKNQYAYMMEGFDSEWVLLGNKRTATFTNLDAGNYTFRVKASNSDGIWSNEETHLIINITPPWWETLWFRGTFLLLIVGLFMLIYKIRIRVIKRKNRNLDKHNKELNKEIISRKLAEDEIRAYNEELTTTTDALKESNDELIIALEKAKRSKELQIANKKLLQNEDILTKAHNSLKLKQTQLEKLNLNLKESHEETQQLNEELIATNDQLYTQREELETTLSRLKETQSQLIQSEKMASVGILTAGIAHEINNPLNFIQGGKLAIETYIEENIKEHLGELLPLLEIIETGVSRISDIIQSLNRFNRRGSNKNEKCDIHIIINNCLIMLNNQTKNKIEITQQLTKTPFIVNGNEGELHQAILNMLTNAIQSIEEKGTISITTKMNKEKLTIQISDSGYGISEKNIKKVTDPFFTTKDPGKGTGLGMSIAYSIIEKHNGSIKYKSKIGIGTDVIVTLPISW